MMDRMKYDARENLHPSKLVTTVSLIALPMWRLAGSSVCQIGVGPQNDPRHWASPR